jgi:hypothetical protein
VPFRITIRRPIREADSMSSTHDQDTERGPEVPEPASVEGRHTAEQPAVADSEATTTSRAACRACHGTGHVLTTRDLLDEVVAALPSDPAEQDAMIAEFYRRLLATDSARQRGDQLAPLFPPDLTTGDALNTHGHRQRDMLLNYLVALLSTWDPDNLSSPAMEQLERQLEQAGRSHVFRRPDGSVRAATKAEYDLVGQVLIGLLFEVFGFPNETLAAVAAAYDDAALIMRKATRDHVKAMGGESEFVGRMPRQGAAQ